MTQTIAILTTGDEVVEGEILNTNSQSIAQLLTEQGFEVATHISCRDEPQALEHTIRSLLTDHSALIITGGLGPTADDRTRFVIADICQLPLEKHLPSWQWIEDKYKSFNRDIPATNQQQALFPRGAQVLANDNGSADGCLLSTKDNTIVMLPGPPRECMPMLTDDFFNLLKKYISPTLPTLYKWRLFGVAESQIAAEINQLLPNHCHMIAYRWHYPYIDIKFRSDDASHIDEVVPALNKLFAANIICDVDSTASQQLYQLILKQQRKLILDDQLTGGELQRLLQQPQTSHLVSFGQSHADDAAEQIELRGLVDYWTGAHSSETDISIAISKAGHLLLQQQHTVPNRSLKMSLFAVELVAAQLCIYLSEQDAP
jgi:nicotinamide-nucleotide amidase